MAVIFDEVTAEVQAPAPSAPIAPRPEKPGGSSMEPHALRRELERQAERQARLKAD